jgi:hypothetical protein
MAFLVSAAVGGSVAAGAALAGIAVGGASLAGAWIQADAATKASKVQSDAATTAADTVKDSTDAALAAQKDQFDKIQTLLKPYVDTGNTALQGQGDLAGLNGADAQKAAVDAIQGGAQFQGLVRNGEDAILQNASATGGVRGGNVQGALAQFRPQLLSSLIDQQYQRLGGLTQVGANAATGQAGAYSQQGAQEAGLLSQLGRDQAGYGIDAAQAQAGGILGQFNPGTALADSLASGLGVFSGLGGFKAAGSGTGGGGGGGGGGSAARSRVF